MSYEWTKPIAAYFNAAADGYARSIDPVFRPLAESLVEAVGISIQHTVLDLGTGTGLAAQSAARFSPNIIAVDFSEAMLRIARQRFSGHLIRADIHRLPLSNASIDVILASFALNSTDPAIVVSEASRVLRGGGPFGMQEWAENDELSDLVSELFAEYMVDDPPPDLQRLREQMQLPIPWDDVDSIDALAQVISDAGFRTVNVEQITPQIALSDAETFLQYKLAWPIRAAELAAMSDEIRSLCLSDLRENIAPYVKRSTGQLIWKPNIVRIIADK